MRAFSDKLCLATECSYLEEEMGVTTNLTGGILEGGKMKKLLVWKQTICIFPRWPLFPTLLTFLKNNKNKSH